MSRRNPIRLWLWLLVMDVIAWRWYGSRAYLWAVGKAAANEDWGTPPDGSAESGEAPF